MRGPLRVAVTGLGGFAGNHHQALAALEAEGECRVVATCDPAFAEMSQEIARYDLVSRGVRIFPELSDLLGNEEVDVVTLPTPIPLHAAQHAAVVAAGAACYLEKPPSLWWPEFQGMLERDVIARRQTHVGFNFVGDPFRFDLKRRILCGEFGALRTATLCALWPRDRAYFQRNGWAGRLYRKGQWILDSCIGNALAHYVQNLLFWCGTREVESVGEVANVQASLFRAHPIESFDTVFLRAAMANGATVRIAASHAADAQSFEKETLTFEKATIRFANWRTATIEFSDGREEALESPYRDQGESLRENFRRYFEYVRGLEARPVTRLRDSQSFVALNDLAFLSSGRIGAFEGERVSRDEASGRLHISGLAEEMWAFVEGGTWPGEPPRSAVPAELGRIDLSSLLDSNR